MNEGWIKLYRKSKDNPLMRDANAWMIFTWILLSVDRKTAKMNIGRVWASAYFKMPQSTFYKSLKRLEQKYKVLELIVNNKGTNAYTTIRVLNWAKYQAENPTGTIREQSTTALGTHIQEGEGEGEIKNYDEKSSDELSELKKSLGIPEEPLRGINHEFQAQAMELIEALGVTDKRKSAYFKAVKENPRNIVLDAYAFAVDYPDFLARDKMFFWKLNDLKKGLNAKSN